MLKDKLTADFKQAMLAKDKTRTEVIKGLKSAILYEEVAQKKRDVGLGDDQILVIFARESKKRAESAELYQKIGSQERAESELAEKAIIDGYLPKQLSDQELTDAVNKAVAAAGPNAQFGPIIAAVKAQVGQAADGKRIADAVKAKLS
jgi:hypothetical protein